MKLKIVRIITFSAIFFLFLFLNGAEFAGGSGTSEDPYLIETAEHLDNVRNHLDSHFRQISDIDLAEKEWEPIGSWQELHHHANQAFQGTYNGDGYIIRNLTIHKPRYRAVALFAYLGEEGKITGTGLEDVNVTGKLATASLVAFMDPGSQISTSYATGSIEGDRIVGGLAGYVSDDPASEDPPYALIENSFARVDIQQADRITGGLVGRNRRAHLKNCYAAGEVTGNYSGGIVGVCVGEIENCYYNRDVSRQPDRGKGEALSPEEMSQQESFKNWDFNNTWIIEGGMSYPHLRLFQH